MEEDKKQIFYQTEQVQDSLIKKLIQYKEKNGDFQNITADKEVGPKVSYIRKLYNRKRLDEKLVEKLNKIDFPWRGEDEWFEIFCQKLIEYKEKNGSFYGLTKDKEIGVTVLGFRASKRGYGNTAITEERVRRLDEIGFPWDGTFKSKYEIIPWFDDFYEKLIKYKDKNGSFKEVQIDKEIGFLVRRVKRAYKHNDKIGLTQEMIEKLNKICFPFDQTEIWFDEFCDNLIEHKKINGGFAGLRSNEKLYQQVHKVRCAKNGKGTAKLTVEMIQRLDDIGFPWSAREYNKIKSFDEFYNKLVVYKERTGGFKGITADKEIYYMVEEIRHAYRKGEDAGLSQGMIDKLNDIGFPWEGRWQWFDDFYEKLIEYKNKNGNFRGVIVDKEIGSIVSRVRAAKKGQCRTKLTEEMIEQLNVIGFPWEVHPNERATAGWFDIFYDKLKEYKQEKGSFYGISTNEEISKWVAGVRRAYKGKGGTRLTLEMIEKLNEIGFPWEASSDKNGTSKWFDIFYDKLKEYKQEKGSFYGASTNEEIGKWVVGVRRAYKGKSKTRLTMEMIDKLNEIGFTWNAESKYEKDGDLTK